MFLSITTAFKLWSTRLEFIGFSQIFHILISKLSDLPFIKIYVHFVFSTKKRKPLLNTVELRTKVWKHIKENAKEKDIFVDHVNGYDNHCHCLISLGSEQNISKIA